MEEIDLENLPKHIAIIMDGNRRWAKARGLTTKELIKMLDAPGDICSLREAMEIKYARNVLGALKVLFFHELNEAGFNVRKIELILNRFESLDPQGLMAKLCVDGKKGFGGKCFPKDVEALMFEAYKKSKNAGEFFRNILESNDQLRYNHK